jgi:NADPH:quinone reductase-like Zn-dependent oxidoreductase
MPVQASFCVCNFSWCCFFVTGTTYPIVPGHEIVGYVVEVGSEVTKFKVWSSKWRVPLTPAGQDTSPRALAAKFLQPYLVRRGCNACQVHIIKLCQIGL